MGHKFKFNTDLVACGTVPCKRSIDFVRKIVRRKRRNGTQTGNNLTDLVSDVVLIRVSASAKVSTSHNGLQ